MSADPLPRLAVVYDYGAASPTEIARGLRAVAAPWFVVPRSGHVRSVLPALERLGPVSMLDRALAGGRLPKPVAGIVTFSECMVPATARLAGILGLPFHDADVAAGLTDKAVQRQRLAEAGIEQIRFQAASDAVGLESALRHVGYPAVVKPVRSEGSRDVVRVNDAGEAGLLLDGLRGRRPLDPAGNGSETMIVEEYLVGAPARPGIAEYVSVESAGVGGRWRHLAITGNFASAPPFRETGHFWPDALAPGDAGRVLALTDAALRALGVTVGIGHTEIKLTPTGPRVLEVHGRLGGERVALFRDAANLDLVGLAGSLALGRDPGWELPEPRGVHFRYHHQVPTGVTRVLRVEGQHAVRSMPGVASYSVAALPAAVSSRRTSFFDSLCGSAPDHRGAVALLDAVRERLRFTFEFGEATGTVA